MKVNSVPVIIGFHAAWNLRSHIEIETERQRQKKKKKVFKDAEPENPQQSWRIEQGLFGEGGSANTPAPQLWRPDESMSSNYSTSNNTNMIAGLCAVKKKILIYLLSLPASTSFSLLFVISHFTATLVRTPLCFSAVQWSACCISALLSCVQLVGEMFPRISVLPNKLGQERRGPVRNPKPALLWLLCFFCCFFALNTFEQIQWIHRHACSRV